MIEAALGWIGTVGTFVAYVLVSQGRWGVDSLRYASLNTVGGILAGTASLLYGAWPSAAANYVWACVGLVALAKQFKQIIPACRSIARPEWQRRQSNCSHDETRCLRLLDSHQCPPLDSHDQSRPLDTD